MPGPYGPIICLMTCKPLIHGIFVYSLREAAGSTWIIMENAEFMPSVIDFTQRSGNSRLIEQTSTKFGLPVCGVQIMAE